MPRYVIFTQPYAWFSIHLASGYYTPQLILFIFHGILAFSFIIGYRTRMSTILLWLMTLSLQNRNLHILHGGDVLMRILLLFSIFLPLSDCYSVDNAYFNKVNFQKIISNCS